MRNLFVVFLSGGDLLKLHLCDGAFDKLSEHQHLLVTAAFDRIRKDLGIINKELGCYEEKKDVSKGI